MLAVQDVAEVLRREYPQAIDIAYEGVGGVLRQAVLDNLSPSGCLLSVGYISEYPHVKPDIDEGDQHSSERQRRCWTEQVRPATGTRALLAAPGHQARQPDPVRGRVVWGAPSCYSCSLGPLQAKAIRAYRYSLCVILASVLC